MAQALGHLRAIVTGAGRGIGAAIAGGLAASGAHVVFADRTPRANRRASLKHAVMARRLHVAADRSSKPWHTFVVDDDFGANQPAVKLVRPCYPPRDG
jgi:NAD(P)-dependent dehydrogenase (short-subunit alcohol dehydrogenase family)